MAIRRQKQELSKNDDELSSNSSEASSDSGNDDNGNDNDDESNDVSMDEDEDDVDQIMETNNVDDAHDDNDNDDDDNNDEDASSSSSSSSSSSDNGQDDSDDEISPNSNNNATTTNNSTLSSSTAAPPPISKSWTALTTHSPCYTGGTVSFSHAPSVATTADNKLHHHQQHQQQQQPHYILAQRGADVAIIEASTGLLLRTVRRGKGFQGGFNNNNISNSNSSNDDDNNNDNANGNAANNEYEGEDEEDEESMDADAITAFALAPNNVDMIAVTRSHLVRKYSLAVAADEDGASTATTTTTAAAAANAKEDANSTTATTKGNAKPPLENNNVATLPNPAKVSFSFGKSGHKLPVTKIAFHESGIFFATGSVDGLVKVWDVRNGYATHALHPTTSSSGAGSGSTRGRYAVTCLTWRSNATSLVLAIGREDGSVSIHDLLLNAQDTKKASMPVAVMRDHVSAVTCVAWSEGGGVGSGSGGGIGGASGRKHHGGGVFFSSGRDSVINTWLISEQEVTAAQAGGGGGGGHKRKKKKAGQQQEDALPEVSIQVTYRRIRTLPVYEQVESMVLLSRRFRPASESKEQQDVLDRKDVVLATCGTKGVVRLWKASYTGSEGLLVITDLSLLASQKENESFGEENGGYTSLHLTSLSNTHLSPLLVAVDAEHNMTFLRMEWMGSTLGFATDRAIVGHNGEILDLAVIPSGPSDERSNKDKHTVAVATNSSQVRLFGLAEVNDEGDDAEDTAAAPNLHTHTALSPRGMLDGHSAIVLSIDASPCGRYLVTAGKDKTMRLWHIPSQECIAVATGHTEAVGSVALSRKIGCYDVGGKAAESGAGAFAVTASKDRTLKVWALPGSAVMNRGNLDGEMSLRARLSARAHEKDINIVSVAPNDSLIATGSQDKTVKLWRATDLGLHGTLKGHKRGIWDCQFSPHDRVVATASGDRTLKLWSIADCSCVRTFQGHMAGVLRVRFLSTGLQLISSGSDGLIKLWTIRTNECESTIDGHDDKIWALDLSPCGTALFSGGADSKIAVWRDTTTERDDAVKEAEEKNIIMEQKLSNHLRHKQYEEALEIALELDKPHQVLRVLTEIVEKDTKNNRGVETLQKHAANWPLNRLTQILRYCREWNTRARNSNIAMLVVKSVVTTIPAAKLASYEGIPEILAGIAPYAERHFDRLDGLVGNSYLLDFTLFSMGSLHGDSSENYADWAERSKFLAPPRAIEGKIQIGGSIIVGAKKEVDGDGESSDEDVITIGDSDSSDEE